MPLLVGAWIGLVGAVLLAVACHPAIFYGGRPTPMPMGSLNDLFYWGQWLALGLAIAAAVLFGWAGSRAPTVVSAVLVVYLIVTGVPHRGNRYQWHAGKLGVVEFVRSVKRG